MNVEKVKSEVKQMERKGQRERREREKETIQKNKMQRNRTPPVSMFVTFKECFPLCLKLFHDTSIDSTGDTQPDGKSN